MAEGFNSKIRELRGEFFSRAEFKTAEMRFMSHQDLDKFRKDISAQIQTQKSRVNELIAGEKEMGSSVSKMNHFMDKLCTKDELAAVNDKVMDKATYD